MGWYALRVTDTGAVSTSRIGISVLSSRADVGTHYSRDVQTMQHRHEKQSPELIENQFHDRPCAYRQQLAESAAPEMDSRTAKEIGSVGTRVFALLATGPSRTADLHCFLLYTVAYPNLLTSNETSAARCGMAASSLDLWKGGGGGGLREIKAALFGETERGSGGREGS